MNHVVTSSARLSILARSLLSLRLCLFENDHEPSLDDVPANFTEANFPGYVSVYLGDGRHEVSSSEGVTRITVRDQNFAVSRGGGKRQVYGYYVVDDAAGFVLAAARFQKPRAMSVKGTTIKIDLILELTAKNDVTKLH